MRTFQEVLADINVEARQITDRADFRQFCKQAIREVRNWSLNDLSVTRYLVEVHSMSLNQKLIAVMPQDPHNPALAVIEQALYADMRNSRVCVTSYALNGKHLFGPKRSVALAVAFIGADHNMYVGGSAVDKHDKWDSLVGRWQAISTAVCLSDIEADRLYTLRQQDDKFKPDNKRCLKLEELSPYHTWIAQLPPRSRSAAIYCAQNVYHIFQARKTAAMSATAQVG